MENQKQKKELVVTQNLNELRNELSEYGYETTFDDIILLFQESMKRKGEKVSAEKMEEVITHFWNEWESSGSPMGYNTGKLITKDRETGRTFAIVDIRRSGRHNIENPLKMVLFIVRFVRGMYIQQGKSRKPEIARKIDGACCLR